MDFLSAKERSRRMASIRKKHTKPELLVRRIAHSRGFRFRLHDSRLPGTPDLCFARLRKIIEIRGCFWHSHVCRKGKAKVASRIEYWRPKLARNVKRDARNLSQLKKLGWVVLVIWECQTKNVERLTEKIAGFLKR